MIKAIFHYHQFIYEKKVSEVKPSFKILLSNSNNKGQLIEEETKPFVGDIVFSFNFSHFEKRKKGWFRTEQIAHYTYDQ